MDNREHLYSGFGIALRAGICRCIPCALLSKSDDEAIGKVIKKMEDMFPRSDGWFDHQAGVFKVSTQLIRDCSQIVDAIDQSINENRD